MLIPSTIFAQSRRIDSMRAVLQTQLADTVRIKTLNDLAFALYRNNPDQSEQLARQSIALAQRLRFVSGLAFGYLRLANAFYGRSQFSEALRFNDSALVLFRAIGDSDGVAQVFTNAGAVFAAQGNDVVALEYLINSLTLYEKLKNHSGMSVLLGNIGDIYRIQHKTAEALEYYTKALPLAEKYNPQGVIVLLSGIGSAYREQGKLDQALGYLQRAATIAEQQANNVSLSVAYRNIGIIRREQGRYSEAVSILLKAVSAAEKGRNKITIARALIELATTQRMSGNITEAVTLAQRALDSSISYGVKPQARDAAAELASAHHAARNDTKAYEAHQIYSRYKDSVNSEEAKQKLAGYEFATKLKQQQAETEALRKEQAAQRIITYAIGGGLAVAAVLLLLVVRSNTQRKRAFNILNEQKKLLEEQAREIELANRELHTTNEELTQHQVSLEERTREIEVAYESLRQTNAELEQLNREKSEFLAIASHDLKNPLSSILLVVSRLKRYIRQIPTEDVIVQISSVEKMVLRMVNILVQILDLQTLEEGKIVAHPRTMDISTLLADIVEEYSFRAEQKDIQLIYEPQNGELWIECDESLLRRVLDNLLSNAVKFSPHGKRVFLRSASNSETVRLEIKDEGQGFSEEDKSQLFKNFTRLSAQPTGGEHSSGLGLSIVKKLVDAMHGNVWCESEAGNGATFIVELRQGSST